jgi:hypothetical protein
MNMMAQHTCMSISLGKFHKSNLKRLQLSAEEVAGCVSAEEMVLGASTFGRWKSFLATLGGVMIQLDSILIGAVFAQRQCDCSLTSFCTIKAPHEF